MIGKFAVSAGNQIFFKCKAKEFVGDIYRVVRPILKKDNPVKIMLGLIVSLNWAALRHPLQTY